MVSPFLRGMPFENQYRLAAFRPQDDHDMPYAVKLNRPRDGLVKQDALYVAKFQEYRSYRNIRAPKDKDNGNALA
jgi:hypothetical protein